MKLQHHIERLERGAETLRASLADLGRSEDFEALVPTWRRPGWTTPAEYLLVASTIEAMVGLTNQLIEMKRVLIAGSEQVGLEG